MDLPKAIELLPSQDRFIFSRARYTAFVGGIGSGKSWAGALKSLLHCRPAMDGMVVAPTYRMLADSTQAVLLSLLDMNGIGYARAKADDTLIVNGARVLLRSADDPQRLRGPSLNWCWCDEGSQMTEECWLILLGRLRVGDPSAWVSTTPRGLGTWLYKHFVEQASPQHELVTAATRDNIHLPASYVADLYGTYEGQFAEQELSGLFVTLSGVVYAGFDPAVHVVEPHPIPEGWTFCRSIDAGYRNPLACLWGGIDGDGRVEIIDEHYAARVLLSDHAAKIKARPWPIRWSVCDPAAAQERGELRALGIPTESASKDVQKGIQRVANRFKVAGDGRPRLRIWSRCKNLIRELRCYTWEPARPGGLNEKEQPRKQNDHACDALRYLCVRVDLGDQRIMSLYEAVGVDPFAGRGGFVTTDGVVRGWGR